MMTIDNREEGRVRGSSHMVTFLDVRVFPLEVRCLWPALSAFFNFPKSLHRYPKFVTLLANTNDNIHAELYKHQINRGKKN